jgi:hypothetical protein
MQLSIADVSRRVKTSETTNSKDKTNRKLASPSTSSCFNVENKRLRELIKKLH